MIEQEYIDITDLQKIRTCQSILLDIVVKNSSVITKKDYHIVGEILCKWSDELYNKLNK